jgi:methylphosphotriester-DNA--protein-cysteine methyltransferase
MEPEVVISVDKREDDRYHEPTCQWCGHIRRANKRTVTAAQAEEEGYKACSECKPGS